MKYDDGFVAYLNGHRVAAANAPEQLQWNSRATGGHDDSAAMQFAAFNISNHRDKLVEGKNILAIHAMNLSAESTDMLLVAEIETNDYDFEKAIGELVDLDAFYKFWAIEGLLGFWDGYSGNRNNFFVYLNPKTDKFHFLPWGADALFEKFSKLRVDRRAPVSVKTMGRIAHRLYQLPSGRARYAKAMQELLDKHWDEEALLAEVERAQAMIQPHLTPAQKRALPRGEIRKFIPSRRADVLKEISGDMPLWASAPGPPPVIGAPRNNNNNNLWAAARKGDIRLLGQHLAKQDVNARDRSGGTALDNAALAGKQKTVAFLIEKGAHVNSKNNDGNTALHAAAFVGRLEITQLLVKHGADINIKNRQGETALNSASAPWSEEIEGIMGSFASRLQIKLDLERVKADRPKVAAFLRSSGGKLGANVVQQDIWGAALRGDLELLKKQLANGTNVNVRAADGATPLVSASLAGRLEIVQFLIEKGANINTRTNNGDSPLHAAAFTGELQVVQLLTKEGAKLNQLNNPGQTPLDNASGPWNEELEGIITFLETAIGIKFDRAKIKAGRPKVAEFLAKNGGKSSQNLPKPAQGDVWTAAKTGNIAALKQHIAKDADLDAQDARLGITPLAWAGMSGQLEAAKLIISKGGNVNAQNKDGSVALHGAAFLGQVKIVELLLKNDADVNPKNAMGETPFGTVAQPWNAETEGIIQFIGTILQIKVDLNQAKTGRPQVAELLRKHGGKTAAELK